MQLPKFILFAGGVLLSALLSGCVLTGGVSPADDSTIPSGPFATDDDALAAAESTYEKYLEIMSATMRGDENGNRLGEVAMDPLLVGSVDVLIRSANAGNRSTGTVTGSDYVLRDYSPAGEPASIITIQMCRDVSQSHTYDSDGELLVRSVAPDRSTMEVTFGYDYERKRLLASGNQILDTGPC
ncbi:hypothetical protein [Rhodoglobus aureus]|uniref:Lipoprotein n=1 Tax=Rhodoglobus aureus TaxID=191497 RepID=A0ABP4FYF5_9MICO